MCYILDMNKDVIYIESEDDITDIITKIEKSKERIIALVPPKRAGVFRSIVNIKLIAKAGTTNKKSIVLVTTDPSIIKLAAATKLPVAKNLQTAPVIPAIEPDDSDDETTESIDELPDDEEEDVTEADEKKPRGRKSQAEEDEEEKEDEPLPAKKTKSKQKKPTKGSPLEWFKNHKKITIFGIVCILGLIAFLIWAFGFAPAVDIDVSIKTDPRNFSEGITFTESMADEDAKAGKIYLEPEKYDSVQEVTFEASGQKNKGAKATGDLAVAVYFPYNNRGIVAINAGDKFTYNGNLTYVADEAVRLEYSGSGKNECVNKENKSELIDHGCKILKHISVTAAEPGSKYNIAESTVGWSTTAPVDIISSEKAMTGGTDDIVTVVQQSDIEAAKAELMTANENDNKQKLYDTIGDKYYIIESSFEQKSSDIIATPGVDEEVSAGSKPSLKVTTTSTVYAIDKIKLEEYINSKVELDDNQKIYDIQNIYLENIYRLGNGASARLKARYFVGPKVTETEVIEQIKGKGIGDASRTIRDLYGVTDVTITPSYPWVMMVPADSNRITIKFNIKDQEGNKIEKTTDETKDNEDGGQTDDNSSENEE